MPEQFELLEKLGSGGMGVVYRARDKRLGRIVAIKLLSGEGQGSESRRQRFFQEAQAASALNHPNIVTIHTILSENGDDLIVMECVAGKTLSELIPKGGLRVPQIINYGLQITDALAAAHNAGIIHRDLKPSNIMVTDRGLVKVLDFGLAKMADSLPVDDRDATKGIGPVTMEGSILGTAAYMSPEQAQGQKVDARSDIFALGAVFYEMATGCPAFEGGNAVSTLTAVLRDETRPIFEIAPDVPPQFEGLIQRCLRKSPDERWQSMAELHNVLLALKAGSDSGTLYRSFVTPPPPLTSAPISRAPITPPPPPLAPPPAPPPPVAAAKKATWPRMAAVLGVVAVLIAGALFLWLGQRKPIPATSPLAGSADIPVPKPLPADGVLRNENILEMVKAKVPPSLIVSQIQSGKTDFNLSSAEVIRLVQAGASESVIEAMRNPTKPSASPSAQATPAPSTPFSSTPPPSAPFPPTSVNAPANKESLPSIPKVSAVTIPDGTPIRLSLAEDVAQDSTEGAPLKFVVVAAVEVNGRVVIKEGAAATGALVDEAKKRRLFGGGSKATYLLQTVESADGKQLRIRTTPAPTSGDGAKRPLRTGKKAQGVVATKGTEYPAYIDGDATVNVRP